MLWWAWKRIGCGAGWQSWWKWSSGCTARGGRIGESETGFITIASRADLSARINRDIKPHNLLLTAQGHIQLTDFGSAAPLAHLPAPPTFSLGSGRPPPRSIARKYARALVGTPDYIAPEILHNAERVVQDWRFDESAEEEEEGEEVQAMDGEERAYGCEVDWWSLGVTVYEVSCCSRGFPLRPSKLRTLDALPSCSMAKLHSSPSQSPRRTTAS